MQNGNLKAQGGRAGGGGIPRRTSARPRQARGCARSEVQVLWPPQQKTAREAGHGEDTSPQQLPLRGRIPAEVLPATRARSTSLAQRPGRAWTGLRTRLRDSPLPSSARGTPSTRKVVRLHQCRCIRCLHQSPGEGHLVEREAVQFGACPVYCICIRCFSTRKVWGVGCGRGRGRRHHQTHRGGRLCSESPSPLRGCTCPSGMR
jgi:hypothetical protein